MKFLLTAVLGVFLLAGNASAAELVNLDTIWDDYGMFIGADSYDNSAATCGYMAPAAGSYGNVMDYDDNILVDVDNFWGNQPAGSYFDSYSYSYNGNTDSGAFSWDEILDYS